MWLPTMKLMKIAKYYQIKDKIEASVWTLPTYSRNSQDEACIFERCLP